MRKEDLLYFSPKYKFTELNSSDKDKLLDIFKDRVYGFYLNPAKDLCKEEHAFAAGVICSATIEFLAKIKYGKPTPSGSGKANFKIWLTKNISKLSEQDADKFYRTFRCGLIHGGKIDECGQFSFDFDKLIKTISTERDIMIVNPKLLLEVIINYFDRSIKDLKEDNREFRKFEHFLKEYFKEEIEYSRAS